MAKKDELAVQETAVLARPDFIKEGSRGLDEVGLKDMILPRLVLCQTGTRQRSKQEPSYIKGLEEGNMFNMLTERIYGESVQVVPLFFYHSRIYFKSMDEGGGIICQAPDGKACQLNHGGPCLHATWGPGGEPPDCTEFFNYPSIVYDGPGEKSRELIIVSLKTTGLDAGKRWNSMMRLRGTDSFAGVYSLSAVPDKNEAGQPYFTWTVKQGNPPWVDAELFQYAEKQHKIVYEGLKAGTITAQPLDESEEAFAGRDSEV